MDEFITTCPICDSIEVDVQCGQIEREGHILWFRSWNCLKCGFQLEEDGDDTPEIIRSILMKSESQWSLMIDVAKTDTLSFKIIKHVIWLSLKDISNIKKDPQGMVFIGTKVEASFYYRKCKELGLILSCMVM